MTIIAFFTAVIAIALGLLAWRVAKLEHTVRGMEEICTAQREKIDSLAEKMATPCPPNTANAPCNPAPRPEPAPEAHRQPDSLQPAEMTAVAAIYLAQNQDDIFITFSTAPQPGSLFKATPNPSGNTAEFVPTSLNFLQCRDHFKAISLTADSCLAGESTTFQTVTPGVIEKASDGGHTFWEIKRRALVRLCK